MSRSGRCTRNAAVDFWRRGRSFYAALLTAWIVAAAGDACAQPWPVAQQSVNAQSPILMFELPPPVAVAPTPGMTTPLPKRYSQRSGLHVACSAGFDGEMGYVPLEIQVTARKASGADRTLRFRFEAGSWRSRGRGVAVEQEFVFPGGATSQTFRTLAPRHGDWSYGSWTTWVDGRPDDQLSAERIGVLRSGAGQRTSVMAIGRARLGNGLQQTLQGSGFVPGEIVESRWALNSLPENWLEVASYDVAIAYPEELQQLSVEQPARLAALRKWVYAGGNLWIVAQGSDWSTLLPAEQALESADATAPSEEELPPGWQLMPLMRERGGDARELLVWSQGDLASPLAEIEEFVRGAADGEVNFQRARRTNQLLAKPFGLGLLVAIPDELVGNGNWSREARDTANLLSRSAAALRASSYVRWGFGPDDAASEFNNWLIPGVGMAPVTAFQVLITLFVIAVGPVNYWLLARRGRLPMLLVTAPIAALVAVALLFTYGLITDGVSTRVRARSLTMLDQRTGRFATWARLSYYAGMAPGGGLTMADDTVVFPISPRWAMERAGRGSGQVREVTWEDGRQRLSRGWLPSRTPVQTMAATSRTTTRQLKIREGDNGIQVENLLGADVVALAVQDERGRFYWTEELASEATQRLAPTDWADLATGLRGLFADNELSYPVGAEPSSRRRGRSSGMGDGALSNNLLESQLRSIISPTTRELGDRNYVAVTRRSIELELGLPQEQISEEASFHVVRGSW
ncbi:MAG: hypothetical protein CMJ58_09620 [Planctomycetaceae bacterium]|nr:hypothetical protein [Planctomycetaceae bacterium]